MSRAGYTDDCDDQWAMIMWRGAVASAIKGKRGQAFLKELVDALDAMPEKRLIPRELEQGGEVCALGSIGRRRGVDLAALDPFDSSALSGVFGVAEALIREIEYENDEASYWRKETPEDRWKRMRAWAESHIAADAPQQGEGHDKL